MPANLTHPPSAASSFVCVGARAQDSDTCDEVNAVGLLEDDGFPSDSAVYTNALEDDVRGEYISDSRTHFIW